MDISETCIRQAQTVCPGFQFLAADILKENVLENRAYDCLIACEFLEHIEQDLAVLNQMKAGTLFFRNRSQFSLCFTCPAFQQRGGSPDQV
ncbi:hypothetical protein JW948_05900 [bacterium]|nr:hypothetical protein [bacterium]